MVNNDHYNTYRSRKGIPVEHTCDRSKLPAGTVILKVMKPKVVRTVVNTIEEHHFEVLKVKYPDGSISQVYLPCDADALSHLYDEVVPGTHITSSLLSYLLFNRYRMCSRLSWVKEPAVRYGLEYVPTEPGQLGGQGCASTQQVEPRLEEHPKAKHNDAYTNKIVEGLRSELYDLLALAEEFMSDLM